MNSKSSVTLRQIPIFAELGEEDELLLNRFTKQKKFPEGTALLKSGQICSHIYLILDCEVIRSGLDHKESVLSGGDTIGVVEVLKGQPMNADYRVSQEGHALVIPSTALEEILLLSPTLATSIIQGLQ